MKRNSHMLVLGLVLLALGAVYFIGTGDAPARLRANGETAPNSERSDGAVHYGNSVGDGSGRNANSPWSANGSGPTKDGDLRCANPTNSQPRHQPENDRTDWPYADAANPVPYGRMFRVPAMPAIEPDDFKGLEASVSYVEGVQASHDTSKILERSDVLALRVDVQDILSSASLGNALVEVRSVKRDTKWRANCPNGSAYLTLPFDETDTYVIRARAGEAQGTSIFCPQTFGILGNPYCKRAMIGDGTGYVEAHLRVRAFSEAQIASLGYEISVKANSSTALHGVVLYRESLLGQTDSDGQCRVVLPGRDSGTDPRNPVSHLGRIAIHAAGFLPKFVDLDDPLAPLRSPLKVELSARELVISINTFLNRPSDLGYSNRDLVQAGFDLVPIPGADNLDSVFWLVPPYTPSKVVAGRPETPDRFRGLSTTIDTSTGLANALGETPKATWAKDYGGWYFRQWRYDGAAGRFDVVLPHAGHFGLIVACGAYVRRNGELLRSTEPYIVLHIDATDPAHPKGELHYAPIQD